MKTNKIYVHSFFLVAISTLCISRDLDLQLPIITNQFLSARSQVSENEFKIKFNLPKPSFIEQNTKMIGGDVLVTNLTQEQAQAIIDFADAYDVAGEGFNKIKLDSYRGRPAVYLGHTTNAHVQLFEKLGVLPDSDKPNQNSPEAPSA